MSRDTIAIWAEAYRPDGEVVMGSSSSRDGLPWPPDRDDLLHFREATRNRVLVMGRGTFDKLPASMKTPESTFERPLVVLTHTRPLSPEPDVRGYWHAGTFESARDAVLFAKAVYPEKGVAFIGGPTVIEWAEPVLDRLIVTTINGRHEGDVLAPGNLLLEQFAFERITGVTGNHHITQYDRDINHESKELAA